MSGSGKNQFVVLHHKMPPGGDRPDHWDLMLRDGDELLTWALESPPTTGQKIQATKLANHRLHYLQYEGPIGDARGSVRRVMQGTCHWKQQDDRMVCADLIAGDLNWQVKITRLPDHCFSVEFFD